MEKNKKINDRPLSNYPFLIALFLLALTAATLGIGDEKLAESLAIYAYFFLALGTAIRFFEFRLAEYSLKKFDPARIRSVNSDSIKDQALILIRNIGKMLKNLYTVLRSYLRMAVFQIKLWISDFKRQNPPGLIAARIRERTMLLMNILTHPHITNPGKNLTLISDISRNIAIFLTLFLVISLIYGIMIDWWFVKRYLYNLIYAILGTWTLYIVLRVRF